MTTPINPRLTDHGKWHPYSAHLQSGKRLQGAGDARQRPALCTGVHEQVANAADSVPCDRLHRLALLVATVLLLTGCARSAPIHYYQLAALTEAPAALAARPAENSRSGPPPVIGLGPVSLPEYLERPQIVSRLDPNRLRLAAQHRWAEPLAENITWVLKENLALLLSDFQILSYPWPPAAAVSRQLSIDIIHFENTGQGSARLVAAWTIKDGHHQVLRPARRLTLQVPAPADDYPAIAGALSETLARFSEELAAALRAPAD